jgi:colicin import membrane protein
VKSKQMILTLVVALSVVTGMLGCQKDDTAVKALQELTAEQSAKVKEQNEELANLMDQIESCQGDLAKVKGEAAVIKSKDVSVEVPTLVGEASVESLEALKTAIAETLDKQAAQLTELKAASDACASDLAAATEAAEAAAAEAEAAAAAELEATAKAAEEAADAKKAAAARKARKAAQKPAIVKQREAEGRPTTGTGSRYEKRE